MSLLGNAVASGLQNGIVIARQEDPDANESKIMHDVGALGMQSLLGNSELRSAKATKELQAAMGPLPTMVEGKDISALRREKKEARKRSDSELIAQQNERFIRNRLSKTKIEKSQCFKTPCVTTETTGGICNPIAFVDSDINDRQFPVQCNLDADGYSGKKSVDRRSKIRRASLKVKYDKSLDTPTKDEAAMLVDITKHQSSPSKEKRISQLIDDTIEMGLDTGEACEMMIAELSLEL